MNVPGGVPPPRPDQQLQSRSRAGVGPAPQTNVFSRIIVVTGGTGGIFLYSPTAGPGNLIGSWTAQAGTDQYGNSYPKGINVTSGVLSGVAITALQLLVNPGPSFFDGPAGAAFALFTTSGVNNWTAPAGITSVQAFCWGPGGNGGNGAVGTEGGGGGGGGEFASELTVGVTPATVYHPTVGTPGSSTTFAGDSLTVTAHSGSNGINGSSAPGAGGLGGTGSTNTNHNNGGPGGAAGSPVGHGSSGGGGGSGGSSTQAGNAGQAGGGTSGVGGPGGAATIGPNPGGAGGTGGTHGTNAGITAGTQPGGGGGGGGDSAVNPGAAGANGQVLLIWNTGGTRTYAAVATAAGTTDPLTGSVVNVGITTIDPVFGDNVNFNGRNATGDGGGNWQLNSMGVDITTAGRGLAVSEGANGKQGTATLTAGTVVVANTSVTANSRIFLTAQTTGAGPGALRVSARTAGTSFTITSSNAADTSLVAYEIFEPG